MLTPPLVTMASHVAAAVAQHCLERRLVVAHDAEVDRLAPGVAHQRRAASCGCSRGSGRAAAASRRRPARRRCDSTATRTRGTTGTTAALTLASTPATAGVTTVPAGYSAVAGVHVVADATHGDARLDDAAHGPHPRATVEPFGVFHHHDRVGAGGHRRAGHDADRLARAAARDR